jgi:predicted nucleotidyltransferase
LADKVAPSPVRRSIDAATERAVRAFLREIGGKYPVVESILYGSRARGDFRPDSDADIAVVLKGQHGDRAAVVQDMAATALHVMMDTGVIVDALPLWEDEFAHPEGLRNPKLIENIRREGLRL